MKSLSDVQSFTHVFPLEDWPARDTLVWNESLTLGFHNTDPRFWATYQESIYLAGPLGVTGALKNYSLDPRILPTEFSPHFPALIGSPVVTVPLGKYPTNTTIVPNGFGDLNVIRTCRSGSVLWARSGVRRC